MINTNISPRTGTLLVFLAGVLWSTVGVAVKSMESADAFQILLYRSLSLSLYIGFITFILFGNSLFSIVKNIKKYTLCGAFLFCAYLGGIYSLQHTSAANALILFACAPIITAVVSSIFLREILTKVTFVSIILAMFGVLIMVWNDFGDTNAKGNLAAIGSAFGFAFFTVNLRYNKNIEMLPSVFVSGIIGFLFTFFIISFSGVGFIIPQNDFLIAISMGVFQVGSGLVLYTIGSKVVAATQLTILSLGEVFLGPLWVWVAIGEEVSLNTFLGGLIIFAAVLFNAFFVQSKNKALD